MVNFIGRAACTFRNTAHGGGKFLDGGGNGLGLVIHFTDVPDHFSNAGDTFAGGDRHINRPAQVTVDVVNILV